MHIEYSGKEVGNMVRHISSSNQQIHSETTKLVESSNQIKKISV